MILRLIFAISFVLLVTSVKPVGNIYGSELQLVTHYLDEEPVHEESYGIEIVAFGDPASGEIHYRFSEMQSWLYIPQSNPVPFNANARRATFYFRNPLQDSKVLMRVYQPNATAHARCDWDIPQGNQWSKLVCEWYDISTDIYLVITGPRGTEIDLVYATASEVLFVYIPLIMESDNTR